jgi:serine/threonine protein kinase
MIEVADELIGTMVLGRYRIVHRLASGGMGVIYLARSEGAQGFVKPVVIKRILPALVGSEKIVTMFAREARIMSRLSHPGLVGIIDFEQEEGAYLMALEYVHGFHLGSWRRFLRKKNRQFPVEVAIQITIMLLDALHYAHTLRSADGQPLNIVHRDIKPSNVLIDVSGRVKLADFGIARMSTDQTSVVDKSTFKGTFAYSAPELLQTGEPSPQSDLYSCAVLLHEILTGKNAFSSEDVAATAWKVIDHVPPLVSTTRPDVPPGLSEVLAKGLAKSAALRYGNAQEFADELRRVRGATPEDASAQLAEMASQDFDDPEMASVLGLPELSSLDRKWRELVVPSERPERLSLDPRDSTLSTASETRAEPKPSDKLGTSGKRGGLIVAGLGILGVAAGASYAFSRTIASPPPAVIMIEGSVAAVGVETRFVGSATPGLPPSAALPARDALASGPVSAASSLPTSPSSLPSGKAKPMGLTQAFARQEPQVARCFSENSKDATGNAEIAVRFEIGADGRVQSTQVQPAPVAGTALGRCIANVARATDFGPQPRPISFRIPITARAGR